MRVFISAVLLMILLASPSLAGEPALMSTATSVGGAPTATTGGMMALVIKRKTNVNTCDRKCPGNSESAWQCKCDCEAQNNDGFPCFVHRDHNGRFACLCQ